MKKLLIAATLFLPLLFLTVIAVQAAVTDLTFGYGKTATPGTLPNSWVVDYLPDSASADYQLHQETYSFNSGEYVCFLIGLVNVDGPGSVFIDKIELSGPSGGITISNSGFENGTTGWLAWGSYEVDGQCTLSAEAYEGLNAAKLTVFEGGEYAIHGQVPVAITESGIYTLSVYTKVYEATREIPPDNIFAMEVGNKWTYDSNIEREITQKDASTFPKETFEMTIRENGFELAREWYEVWQGYLRYWGFYEGAMFNFDFGLLAAWFPMNVGERKESMAWVLGYNARVNLTADVLGVEPVELDFDTLEAYRLRYNLTITAQGGPTSSSTFDWWVVPYIGVVKEQSDEGTETLVSFAVCGGAITPDSDNDDDGLLDYKELIDYHTDPFDDDTDGDGCKDGAEFLGGRDPLVADPEGDLNMDCTFGLQDAILGFKSLAALEETEGVKAGADLTGDSRIGIEEVLYVLQKISELR